MPYKDKEKQKEYQREYQRKWIKEHPDYHKEYTKQWLLKHPEYKPWRDGNRNQAHYLEYQSKYYEENRENIKEQIRSGKQRLKEEVLTHYSNGNLACVRCGFDDMGALCLDHINNDGAKDRQRGGRREGFCLYRNLRKLGYPAGFQTLCFNCNHLKYRETLHPFPPN